MSSPNQLSKMKREGVGVIWVVGMLNELSAYIRFDLTDEQIIQTAEMIVQEFWYLKAEELVLIFKNGMKSKMFGGFNFQVFAEWVLNYEQGKINALEASHLSNKGKYHINAERTAEAAKISEAAIDWASQQKAIQNLKK
jgi:hypothetical protein